jgi:glycerophosphoryl diester phosphodiesterase
MASIPAIIGHRGAPRDHPENTLAAFLRALELGATGVELDVHVTGDGVVVVHHDFAVAAVGTSGE